MQLTRPWSGEYVPEGHDVHDVPLNPSTSEKLPAGHLTHAVLFTSMVPAGHVKHDVAPGPEKSPGGQATHAVPSKLTKVPAGQREQVLACGGDE